jgi:hypothetical protein
MIEIHLYGNLREYARFRHPGEAVMQVETIPDETIKALLKRLEIPVEKINHVFYNSRLLVTRNKYAILYDLPQLNSHPEDWNLDLPIHAGDRLGLFGMDISLLSM